MKHTFDFVDSPNQAKQNERTNKMGRNFSGIANSPIVLSKSVISLPVSYYRPPRKTEGKKMQICIADEIITKLLPSIALT